MELAGSLLTLRSALAEAKLPLDLPQAAQASQTSHQIVAQLDDYVLPRLVNLEAPLLAVVFLGIGLAAQIGQAQQRRALGAGCCTGRPQHLAQAVGPLLFAAIAPQQVLQPGAAEPQLRGGAQKCQRAARLLAARRQILPCASAQANRSHQTQRRNHDDSQTSLS